jgi:tRNA(Arg) A34 adenosine deaminase TadA
MTEAEECHLRRAIELAAAARAAGDMPYGSLLVGPAGNVLAGCPVCRRSMWCRQRRSPSQVGLRE